MFSSFKKKSLFYKTKLNLKLLTKFLVIYLINTSFISLNLIMAILLQIEYLLKDKKIIYGIKIVAVKIALEFD